MACENTTGRRTFTVTWIIDNFEYCIQKEGERIKSPTFVADILANTKWSLWIYPRQGDYIFLYLYRESDSKGPLEIKINYEFALLTADGSCHLFDTTEENFSTSSYSNSTFVDQDNLFTDFLPNGNLIVRCKMWYDSKKESEGYCKMHTHVGVEKKILTWSVKKFSMLEKGMRPTLKIKSTTNQKLIMSLKLSLTEDKHEALEMSFIYPNSQVQPMYYSNKLFILDSKNVAIPWGDAGVFFDDLSKESKFSLAITKGEIMRKKSQYLREDVLSLLCECAFSTGVTTGEIENSGIYPIPVENQNASFSSLELSKSTATPIPDTPFELKNDIASMLNEGILCDVTLKTKTESFHAHCCGDHDAEIQGINPVYWICLQSCRSHRKNENCYTCETCGKNIEAKKKLSKHAYAG
ncbi:uncharacterized protein CDAR_78571 [Caerostris darwini]|uniref:MATH domain-containing protein n=1 Tax=Caerostris darwini TaxID=1538125 RepID=A0AAV4R151_9ARAC|nr:uncharacterized protein CDAR_78571 [Caerostris darwini]